MGVIVAFSLILFQTHNRTYLEGIDSRLFSAAHFAKAVLPEDYHDRIENKNSVSKEDFDRVVDRFNKLCVKNGLEYLWSLMIIDEQIVFTSSTSPSKDVTQEDHAAFFEAHSNPELYATAFETMQPVYRINDDKWGRIRVVLVPFYDSHERRYLVGASMKITEVDRIVKNTLIQLLLVAFVVLLAGFAISLALADSISRPIAKLTGMAEKIAEGDLDQSIEPCGGQELESLAMSVNRMSLSIRERIQSLEEKDEQLKREGEALRKSEERNRNYVENSPYGIFVVDELGQCLDVNEAACLVTGFDETELLSMSIVDLVAEEPEAQQTYQSQFERLFEKGRMVCELPFNRKGGTEFFMFINAVRLSENRYMVCGLDITEQRRGEKERSLLVTAIEQAAEVVLITDANGVVQYVNPAFEHITGYSRSESVRQGVGKLLKSDVHDEAFHKEVRDTVQGGKNWQGRIVNKRKDGSTFEAELTISPVQNAKGEIVNYVSVQRDVTRETQLESQLRHTQKMEALVTLAGGIAHNFRNALASVLGWIEIATRRVPEGDEVHTCLDRATRAGERAAEDIQRLLTFSRKEEPKRRPMHAAPVIKDALKLLRGALPSSIEFRVNISDDCGRIFMDPFQINQVVMNLGMNALHALQGLDGAFEVDLSDVEITEKGANSHIDLQAGKYVQLTISDTGCGMNQRTLDRIFEPFFTTKEPGEGTGLGLSLVHGIVMDHKGVIRVESKVGEGTSIEMLFPVCPDEIVDSEETDVQEPITRGHESILLVDDDQEFLEMSATGLRNFGYLVVNHSSGVTALEVFRAGDTRFDLVITDQIMPRMTGVEMSKEILQIAPDMPIILVSGFGGSLSREQVKDVGIREALVKPITPRVLAAAIRRVLDSEPGSGT